MENQKNSWLGALCGRSFVLLRKFMFRLLSVGVIPNHIAFIMDGNRRYARKLNLGEGNGYRAGFVSFVSLMKYCYELGIKYITVYAFSIDNFKRKPQEVKYLMDLMMEKIEAILKEESIVNRYGVRVHFVGNLKLLDENVRTAAEMAMKATENNKRSILLICVAYTSTDEIVHAAQESCEELWKEIQSKKPNGAEISKIVEERQEMTGGNCDAISKEEEEMSNERREEMANGKYGEVIEEKSESLGKEKEMVHRSIKLADIEKHMYMGVAPDVDILVRTSGETRLSNFLLWQTWNGLLWSSKALWPETGLRHLVWAVLNFQRTHPFFEKRKKQL